ncbi:hypothetical protein [Klebsiella oxytoca]|uniref:hypothetical protein n=1 Tax=Klebsiella oxytoca TaxID=571 RepID=UPI002245326D|nr:hypothetical protein [Klebsiella oxytoca]MCW9445967.1 hypothetical protein [Klebsiella oxytoca]
MYFQKALKMTIDYLPLTLILMQVAKANYMIFPISASAKGEENTILKIQFKLHWKNILKSRLKKASKQDQIINTGVC